MYDSNAAEECEATADVKVGWTQRKRFRTELPLILLKDCPALGVEGWFTEQKQRFSSIFSVKVRGTARAVQLFVRVFRVSVQLELA